MAAYKPVIMIKIDMDPERVVSSVGQPIPNVWADTCVLDRSDQQYAGVPPFPIFRAALRHQAADSFFQPSRPDQKKST